MTLLQHFRPIILGFILFMLVNVVTTVAINGTPSVSQRLNAKVDNNMPGKMALLQSQKNIDVLALGTSQTNNDFSTAAFEQASPLPVSSFNMGLPGTRYDVMQTYLQYHIKHVGKPRLVVLEVTDALVEDDTVYFYLPSLHYHTIFNHDLSLVPALLKNRLVDPEVHKEVLLSYTSAFYQFRPLFTPLSLLKKVSKTSEAALRVPVSMISRLSGEAQAESPVVEPAGEPVETIPSDWLAKGWSPKEAFPFMATESGIRENAKKAREYYLDPIKQVDFAKLDAFLAFCEQEDIEVVLVQWPSHPAYHDQFRQSRLYEPYHDGLRDIADRYGVRYIDLNQEPQTARDALFADTRHLNPAGAQTFSALLAQRLYIPDEAAILASQ